MKRKNIETIVKDCWNCGEGKEFVYLGDHGTKYNPKHTYECSGCGIHHISSEKLLKGGVENGRYDRS